MTINRTHKLVLLAAILFAAGSSFFLLIPKQQKGLHYDTFKTAQGWGYDVLVDDRIIIHQPATEGGYGQGSDIEIQAKEIMRMRTQLEDLVSRHSGQPIEKVRKDIDRDKILTASEAKEYGLVDNILASRKKSGLVGATAT